MSWGTFILSGMYRTDTVLYCRLRHEKVNVSGSGTSCRPDSSFPIPCAIIPISIWSLRVKLGTITSSQFMSFGYHQSSQTTVLKALSVCGHDINVAIHGKENYPTSSKISFLSNHDQTESHLSQLHSPRLVSTSISESNLTLQRVPFAMH